MIPAPAMRAEPRGSQRATAEGGGDAERVLAAARAERDLYRLGASAEAVALVDEIARRLRTNSFTTAQVVRAAEAERSSAAVADLWFALVAARASNPVALGRLLGRLQGGVVVKQTTGKDSEGSTWVVRWPRRCWPLGEVEPLHLHPDCRGDAADLGVF